MAMGVEVGSGESLIATHVDSHESEENRAQGMGQQLTLSHCARRFRNVDNQSLLDGISYFEGILRVNLATVTSSYSKKWFGVRCSCEGQAPVIRS